jgi:hypothetical protein
MPTPQTKTVALFAAKLGYQTRSFESAARKLNVQLAYVTDRCHELADPWNDNAIAARFANPEEGRHSDQSLRGKPLHYSRPGRRAAVAAVCCPRPGLRANHPAAVEACLNKFRMREVLRDVGLLQSPRTLFRRMPLSPEPEPALLGIQFPALSNLCHFRPARASARHEPEHVVGTSDRLAHLLDRPDLQMKNPSSPREALVEEYIPGAEVAVEGILIDGELKLLAIFDKPDPLEGPFFEETIYVTPPRLSAQQHSAILDRATESIRAIGLTHGPVHAEFRVNECGIWPLEVAPRPIGGMCAASLAFISAQYFEPIVLEELILRHAIGEDISAWQREHSASGVMMIPVPASGIFDQVDGVEEARVTADVTDVQITARLHDEILAWPKLVLSRFYFCKAEARQPPTRAPREAHSKPLQIHPTLPVEHPITGKVLDPRT